MPNSKRRPERAALALRSLAIVSAVALCGCSDQPAGRGETARVSNDVDVQASTLSGGSSSARIPSAGNAELVVNGFKVTLLANSAPRRPLLEQLASELDFELHAPDIGDEPITVNGVDADLRDLLPQLLPDRPYRVAYRFDLADGAHRIARLEVGRLGSIKAPSEELPTPAPPRRTDATEARPEAVREDSVEARQQAQEWREVLDQLDDSDWEERVDAIEWIEPEGEGLGVLIERLANDPHYGVRVAAAEQLEDADTLVSVDALVLALQDPNKEVVLAAIDALEFSDDETVADDIEPLTGHPDAEISEAAREAVDFIRD